MKIPLHWLLLLSLTGSSLSAQDDMPLSGSIRDRDTGRPVAGVTILVPGQSPSVTSDERGRFRIATGPVPPYAITVVGEGYERQVVEVLDADHPLEVSLMPRAVLLGGLVVSASRVQEPLQRSPVSIEKMDANMVRNTPSMSFYEGLQNLAGVEMVTSGLTYSQINTRGFNDTGNARFLQLIDGVDNQTPGLSFAVGNMLGSSDLDLESVEVVSGAASALYGPIAFNGVMVMNTKDPFRHPGLSTQVKVGVNHISEDLASPSAIYDVALRYAQVVSDRFAYKFNFSYFTGEDWHATNYMDVDPGTPEDERGASNPARNALNIYGDDEPRTLEGIGRVSRTGYEERHLLDYDAYSLKSNVALHYRLHDDAELIYQYNFGQGTAAYTGSNRFSINDFTLQQHRIELRSDHYFLRAYSTTEDSNDSYNAKGLGQLINNTWVRDFSGAIVPESAADDMWFNRYAEAFRGNVAGVVAGSHETARSFADEGRFVPGTSEFENAKARLIGIQGLSGAGILSQSSLYHVEGQYDFSEQIAAVDLVVGGNFRMFDMFTNGTLFDDKGGSILIREHGAFSQVSKDLLGERLRLSGSLRYDKNENFDGRFTPRASAVYSFDDNHTLRAAYQTGFRNPTPGDQYIKLNAGPITILGGVPANSEDLTVYQNSFTSASLGPFFGAFGQAVESGTPPPDAVMQAKDLLVKSNVAYIRPEQVESFEVGYRGVFDRRFVVDVSYYFNRYNDFLLNQVVMEPQSPVLAPDGSVNPQAAFDLLNGDSHLYQLYTNAADRVTSQGATAGFTWLLPDGYTLDINGTWAAFDLQGADPNDIPAFNTPKFRTTVAFGNSAVTENFGFSVAWRWQDAFDWTGTFNQLRPGRIHAHSIIDAQVSYRLPTLRSVLKVGANNALNHQIYQAFGSPSIGAVYYVSMTFDELFN